MSVENTLAERGARYGDFTDHAELAQELQDIMRGFHKPGPEGSFVRPWAKLDSVKRQALTVIADKIARILSGDPNYTDNWHDIQGYAKLAEDRCVDTESPQLDLGDAVAADDAFHDAVIHGTGATLGGEHVPFATLGPDPSLPPRHPRNYTLAAAREFPYENAIEPEWPLQGQHAGVRREQDEYVCAKCSKRWGIDENAPESCA